MSPVLGARIANARWTEPREGGGMILVRLCKIALIAAMAFFFSLIAFGNITALRQQLASSCSTFCRWTRPSPPRPFTGGRSPIRPCRPLATVDHRGRGGDRRAALGRASACWRRFGGEDFSRAKTIAVVGLSLGFLLYAVGFVAYRRRWFAMWQSQIWNGEQKAFDFIGMIGVVLVVVLLPAPGRAIAPDDDPPVRPAPPPQIRPASPISLAFPRWRLHA